MKEIRNHYWETGIHPVSVEAFIPSIPSTRPGPRTNMATWCGTRLVHDDDVTAL
jgi:hypothetical protein